MLGKLGLDEWVTSALAPVGRKDLTTGYHESPMGSKQGGKLPGPFELRTVAVPVATPKSLIDRSEAAVVEAEKAAQEALKASASARETAVARNTPTLAKLQPTYDLVDKAYGWVEETTRLSDSAETIAWDAERLNRDNLRKLVGVVRVQVEKARKESDEALKAKIDAIDPSKSESDRTKEAAKLRKDAEDELAATRRKIEEDAARPGGNLTDAEMKNEQDRIAKDVKAVGGRASRAKAIAGAAWDLMPKDPPIDSIAHTAKFTVTAGGNISPNWTLVRFRGPSVSPPLFNLSRQRVHTLDIVMGQPSTPGGKALGDEQRRQLLNQKLDSLRLPVIQVQ